MTCSNNGGAAQCSVKAIDADGDMHGTPACAAAPGDDCNDANKNVHPGAAEACNGIDDDCNGKIDLADGLLPVNPIETVSLGANHLQVYPSIAWGAPSTPGRYFLVWGYNTGVGTDPHVLRFRMFSPDGTIVKSDTTLDSAPYMIDVDAQYGSNEFGYAWTQRTTGSGTQWSVLFRRISMQGDINAYVTPAPGQQALGYDHAHAAYAQGIGWILSWLHYPADPNMVTVSVRSFNGVTLGTEYSMFPPSYALTSDLAANSQVAFAVSDSAMEAARALRSANLQADLASTALEMYGSGSVVAGSESGFGAAWHGASGLTFQIFSASGAPGCKQSLGTTTQQPDDIIPSGTGYLIAVGGTLLPVSNACKFGTPITTGLTQAHTRLAGTSTTGYAVVGSDAPASPGPTSFAYRRFGPLFCN